MSKQYQMPDPTFSTFIASLSSSAMVQLGEIAEPTTGQKEANLPMAKHTIDVIAMLQEKTKGNLTNEENKLIQNVLTDLRMRYIRAINK
ncbi:MAG: hypothetical protein OMM_06754 [Candidatus Magnetoglobus multicellularis str. Araruama]|uniref:DUF1844 domain-containing protein n=1 Tax=Candidatus Magnetoglobus multicellularis str. Araruama TaxID=890399 RepID=A0A1V1PFT2_9BACT|nr:MAG: hypothetical protein OMM_06754 [Candidatus Magnetoglobus multicellularis str. Araruama]